MTNQVYNAFKEVGLEREAKQLSTTNSDGKVISGLGHYIALADSCINRPGSLPGELMIVSLNKINEYISNELNDSLKQKVRSKLPDRWGFTK